MGRELRADQVTVGLSQTAFFTGTAVFGLFLLRLSDIVGRRRILLGMMAVMIVGEVLAALAPDMTVLIITHGIQGVTGLNSAGFGLGAGLSFAILPAVQAAMGPYGGSSPAGYTAALLVGAAIMALALPMSLLMSLLIPRPVDAETAN
ncbi:MFS transporter [Streptomyces sp. NPDC058266]|uniref:MFS transporter n=1 Tax=Streptomyces sp. NPDC058266 TaxID=3346412 RepID=UPI0036E93A76